VHRARERSRYHARGRPSAAVVVAVAVPAPVKMRTPLAAIPRRAAPARDHVSARSRYAIRAGTLVEWKNVPIDAADDDDAVTTVSGLSHIIIR